MPLPAVVVAGLKIAGQLAAAYVIDSMLRPLQGRTRVDLTVRSTTESRKIVYGKTLVSGPIVYAQIAPEGYLTSGARARGALLCLVLALAGHRCQRFGALHLDDVVLPAEHFSWGADGGGTGHTTGGIAYHKEVSYVDGWAHLGSPDQTANAELMRAFPGEWTAQRRGRGVTYVTTMFEYGDYALKHIFKGGAPLNVAVEVEGKNDLYDPRLDASPGEDPTDSLFRSWSDNPALCVADYLIDPVVGMGIPSSRIDWDAVVSAANRCDETIVVRAASEEHHLDGRASIFHPEITEKRYTCNGALYTQDAHRDNIHALLSTMNGSITYTKGQFVVRAYAYQGPLVSITEDDLVGPVEVNTNDDQFRAFNTVRGTFVDPASRYQKTAYHQVKSQDTLLSKTRFENDD